MNRNESVGAADIAIADIMPAKWNVHRAEGDDDAALRGLAASIKANGLAQRVLVRKAGDGYELIDGHRRVAAAKRLGWSEIAADVIAATDTEAQLLTATANLQRIDDDPLLWAELVGGLLDGGMTIRQVAAKVGKDETFVARRARLVAMTEKWRKWFAAFGDDCVTTMEFVARHEAKVQDEVFDEMDIAEDGDEVSHEDIDRAFKDAMRNLDDETPFDTSACAVCQHNTACHGELFPEYAESPRCENAECFSRKWNDETDRRIEALHKKGVKVRETAVRWNVPRYWNATPEKQRKNKEPWVYSENGIRKLVWTEPDEMPVRAKDAMTADEREAARKLRKAHNEWKKRRSAAYDKIRHAFRDLKKARDMLNDVVRTPKYQALAVERELDEIADFICDSKAQQMFESIGADVLRDWGVEVTEDEAAALASADPAETKEAE